MLDIHLYEQHAAVLERVARMSYRLKYTQDWLSSPSAVPLSTALPLQPRAHTGETLLRVLEGFLPDNSEVLQRWARDAGLPDTEPYGLLSHYGEDVAGAAVFMSSRRRPMRQGMLHPLTQQDIAQRIRAIRDDPREWVHAAEEHRFSLGGAQGKFALARQRDAWFLPSGREPSTHIFKPDITRFEDSDIVEHVVMRIAAELGLPTARTELLMFEEEHSLVVERFDRVEIEGVVHRVHQEDFAQATGTPTIRKYEQDGGPGIERIVEVLRAEAEPSLLTGSLLTFGRTLMFSWIIAHQDGHAKNYSLRLLHDDIGLTPLYDLSSFLPYLPPNRLTGRDPEYAHEVDLAFSIAGERRIGNLTRSHWHQLEHALGLEHAALAAWGIVVSEHLMPIVNTVIDDLPAQFCTETIERFRLGAYLRQQSALAVLTQQ